MTARSVVLGVSGRCHEVLDVGGRTAESRSLRKSQRGFSAVFRDHCCFRLGGRRRRRRCGRSRAMRGRDDRRSDGWPRCFCDRASEIVRWSGCLRRGRWRHRDGAVSAGWSPAAALPWRRRAGSPLVAAAHNELVLAALEQVPVGRGAILGGVLVDRLVHVLRKRDIAELSGLAQVIAEGLLALAAGPASCRAVADHPLVRAAVPLALGAEATLEDLGHGCTSRVWSHSSTCRSRNRRYRSTR